jgi:hypothetical protein
MNHFLAEQIETGTQYPSDAMGIPMLDPSMQGVYAGNIERWGRFSRRQPYGGVYHFYTDDYKFARVWSEPYWIVRSGCSAIVEPNYSTHPNMPKAIVLYNIFRKRWIARYCQEHDIGVFVDLCTEPTFDGMALLGVPQGWRSYATRALARRRGMLERDAQRAMERAGTDNIILLVIGGGQAEYELCQRHGWIWVQQENQIVHRNWKPKEIVYGQG